MSYTRCKHCKDVIVEVNFMLGKEWMHVNPNASFPTQQKGTMWRYCQIEIAEPEDDPS
jgi:hypothetical protein